MIRRPPRSTPLYSSAASDVYKRQPNGWMDQYGTCFGGRPQPRRRCVRWGPSPLPKTGAQLLPTFTANFYCVQTAGCITMPLDMELGLSPGDFVLDGDPAPSPKRGWKPLHNFRPMSIVAKRLMDQDGTWHGGRPRPIVLDVSQPPSPEKKRKKGAQPSPIFGTCVLWPNSRPSRYC